MTILRARTSRLCKQHIYLINIPEWKGQQIPQRLHIQYVKEGENPALSLASTFSPQPGAADEHAAGRAPCSAWPRPSRSLKTVEGRAWKGLWIVRVLKNENLFLTSKSMSCRSASEVLRAWPSHSSWPEAVPPVWLLLVCAIQNFLLQQQILLETSSVAWFWGKRRSNSFKHK